MFTKQQTIDALKQAYRVANASDSDAAGGRQEWTKPAMSGEFCQALDAAFRALKDCGVISADELQAIYDTL